MRIGVFCSGGDAPGMNACVRAVVRASMARGHDVLGIRRGYQGLLDEDFFLDDQGQVRMHLRSVSDWSRHGGAFLGCSRSAEFRTADGLQKAAGILQRQGLDALIPIGGDGTFRGAVELAEHWGGQIVGCPGTIDNDLLGTDYTIGFSTAVNTAVEALDKIRDTAESHERMFVVEVMGRHSGYIAVYTALAGGAETLCIPETPTDIPGMVAELEKMRQRGKKSVMMVVAEGEEEGGAVELAAKLQAAGSPYPTRVVVLGHLQRGGPPSPEDRLLASELGCWAVQALDQGANGVMCGRQSGQVVLTPLPETFATHRPIPPQLTDLIGLLSH